MNIDRIGELLQPFLGTPALASPGKLGPEQLRHISTYIDLLLRWNARINLTAIRNPEEIVTRHFGESLFLAACLFSSGRAAKSPVRSASPLHALDFGSGAGFPGLPLKIYVPGLRLTLVESNHKKAAFLAEVIRALRLSDTRVVSARLELPSSKPGSPGLPTEVAHPDLVTMRAVERFEAALAAAANLIRSGSSGQSRSLALLIGRSQAQAVTRLAQDFSWEEPVPVPQSRERLLLIGKYPVVEVSER